MLRSSLVPNIHTDFFSLRRFRLELDGVAQGAFARYEPPGRQVEPRDDGGVDAHRTPARLEDGIANTRELLAWLSKALDGAPWMRRVELVEVDAAGEVVARHVLEHAWPVSLEFATLTADPMFAVGALSLQTDDWSRRELASEPEGARR